MACICHFVFMSCPEPTMGISIVGSCPSVVWRFSNKYSSLFRCRKLALTRETSKTFELIFDIFGRHMGVVNHLGMSCCLSACLSVCSGICQYIHMSRGTFCTPICPGDIWGGSSSLSLCLSGICLSISSSIAFQNLYNCRSVKPVDQHHC